MYTELFPFMFSCYAIVKMEIPLISIASAALKLAVPSVSAANCCYVDPFMFVLCSLAHRFYCKQKGYWEHWSNILISAVLRVDFIPCKDVFDILLPPRVTFQARRFMSCSFA